MIGRYGLPQTIDLDWIRRLQGNGSLLFLGDMDPVDLLIFVWLRENLRPQRVIHFGINDRFLEILEIASYKPLACPCAAAEKKSLDLLRKVFPDLHSTIGIKCLEMLEQGSKIEIDAFLSLRREVAEFITRYDICAGKQG